MVTYIPKTVQKPLLRQMLTTHIPETTKEIGELKAQRKLHYNNVTFRFNSALFQEIKLMAVKENTTIISLVNEAVSTWIKWLRKAEHEEAIMEEAEKTKEELKRAEKILDEILLERKVNGRARGRHKKERLPDRELTFQGWVRRHPNRSWPGKEKIGGSG